MKDTRKASFYKEVRMMLYGYGDVQCPRSDTTEVLHNYVLEYLTILLIDTHNMAKLKGKTKTEDLLYCLKRDRKKYTRVKQLLVTNEELKLARKAFEMKEFEKE